MACLKSPLPPSQIKQKPAIYNFHIWQNCPPKMKQTLKISQINKSSWGSLSVVIMLHRKCLRAEIKGH
jgi:hypothetical protein